MEKLRLANEVFPENTEIKQKLDQAQTENFLLESKSRENAYIPGTPEYNQAKATLEATLAQTADVAKRTNLQIQQYDEGATRREADLEKLRLENLALPESLKTKQAFEKAQTENLLLEGKSRANTYIPGTLEYNQAKATLDYTIAQTKDLDRNPVQHVDSMYNPDKGTTEFIITRKYGPPTKEATFEGALASIYGKSTYKTLRASDSKAIEDIRKERMNMLIAQSVAEGKLPQDTGSIYALWSLPGNLTLAQRKHFDELRVLSEEQARVLYTNRTGRRLEAPTDGAKEEVLSTSDPRYNESVARDIRRFVGEQFPGNPVEQERSFQVLIKSKLSPTAYDAWVKGQAKQPKEESRVANFVRGVLGVSGQPSPTLTPTPASTPRVLTPTPTFPPNFPALTPTFSVVTPRALTPTPGAPTPTPGAPTPTFSVATPRALTPVPTFLPNTPLPTPTFSVVTPEASPSVPYEVGSQPTPLGEAGSQVAPAPQYTATPFKEVYQRIAVTLTRMRRNGVSLSDMTPPPEVNEETWWTTITSLYESNPQLTEGEMYAMALKNIQGNMPLPVAPER